MEKDITKILGVRGNLDKAIRDADRLTSKQLSRLIRYLTFNGYHSNEVEELVGILDKKIQEGDLLVREEHYASLIETEKKYNRLMSAIDICPIIV